MQRITHSLFIDDSGTKEYAADESEYGLRRGNSRFFVFCGVLAPITAASTLASAIIEAKIRYFGDDTVEIKSNWLRMPKEKQRNYLDKYDLDDPALTAFVDEVYELIRNADIKLIAAVIDKKQMQEYYKERANYPPGLAYELIICRVQKELSNGQGVAVIVDDTTGKTPKGSNYKELLARQHAALKKYGSKFWKMPLPALETIKFVNSAHSHLVQVADICGYNVNRQWTNHGDEWDTPTSGSLPMYEYFKKISGKFSCSPSGKVQGYGIVKMPQVKKVPWHLKKT